MEHLIVKNLTKEPGKKMEMPGGTFTIKEVIPAAETTKLHANFVEMAPGQAAYSYHWHETNEEVFYIIQGTASVRTQEGDKILHAGDIIAFPSGPEGAHHIRNASDTEKLIYLDCGAESPLEVTHMPDVNKVLVLGPFMQGMTDDVTK